MKRKIISVAFLLIFLFQTIVTAHEKPMLLNINKITQTFTLEEVKKDGIPDEEFVDAVNEAKEKGLLNNILIENYREITDKATFCEIANNFYEIISNKQLEEVDESLFVDITDIEPLKILSLGIITEETYNTFAPEKELSEKEIKNYVTKIAVKATGKSFLYFEGEENKKMTVEEFVSFLNSVCNKIEKGFSLDQKIKMLKCAYPTGMFWNDKDGGVLSNTPCDHENEKFEHCNSYFSKAGSGIQCHGFALMLSDELFGKNAPVKFFDDLTQLKVGDILRYDDRHSMVIVKIEGDELTVAEANYLHNCEVNWERKVNLKDFENKSILCITRY